MLSAKFQSIIGALLIVMLVVFLVSCDNANNDVLLRDSSAIQ